MSITELPPESRTRTHNSPRAIAVLVNAPQVPHARKPLGLWYSFGTAWHDYVSKAKASSAEARARGLGRRSLGAFDFEVLPGDGCRILRLDTWDAILAFTVEYGQNVAHATNGFWWQKGDTGIYDPGQDPDMPRGCRVSCIDWPRVARRYDGIEVPNLDSLEGERPWVQWLDRDWGVSSGCIWTVRDVTLKPIVAEPAYAGVDVEPEDGGSSPSMQM